MRRHPVVHAHSGARRLNRRALLTLSGAIAGAAGLAGGLLTIERADAVEPPGPAASDDGGLTPHREAYYRRARF